MSARADMLLGSAYRLGEATRAAIARGPARHAGGDEASRICADAAAPASPPPSNGKRAATRRATNATSSATPTRASPARSRTACCCKASPAACSKAWPSPASHGGAQKGLLYLRGEYQLPAARRLKPSSTEMRRATLLGANICGVHGFDFDIEIHLGAGAYICGEETALIESLEGKPGTSAHSSALPGDLRLSRPADRREQCRDSVQGDRNRLARRTGLRRPRHQAIDRHEDSFGLRRLRAARPLRISVRRARRAGAGGLRRVRRDRRAGQRRFGNLPDAAGIRPPHRLRGRADRRLVHGVRQRTATCSTRRSISRISSRTRVCGFCTPCRVGTALVRASWTRSPPATARATN